MPSRDQAPVGTNGAVVKAEAPVAAIPVVVLALATLYSFPMRRWFGRWGAPATDCTRMMVGDAAVVDPTCSATLAITVDARPEHIWPWLVQMGYQRGGLNSYDWLHRLFGYLDRPSADAIRPQFQQLAVGDEIPIGRGQGFRMLLGLKRRAEALAAAQGNCSSHVARADLKRSVVSHAHPPKITEPNWIDARNALLACGVLSSLLYVISIDVIAAIRHPDYHGYTSQMVSELMAVGAPTRTLLTWLFVPYNLLVFAFAAGVLASAEGKRAMRLTAAALVAYGVASTAGLLLTPMDLRGTVASSRDTLHIVATCVMSLFIVAAMALGAVAHGKRFRRYSFATIATVVVFGALAGYLAGPMPGPTPWLGLAERVNIYATMLWMSVFAVSLLRDGTWSSRINDETARWPS